MMKNRIQTVILKGDFYKYLLEDYRSKIRKKIKTENYKIVIFYFGTKNNNYFSVNQKKIFEKVGFNVDLIHILYEDEFINLLKEVSNDERVLGINMELPLPFNFSRKILELINPKKDLDCLNPINYYDFLISRKEDLENVAIPSVANAVYLMLSHYGIDFQKKDVVILGNSLYTGLAIAHLLIKFDSTVQIINQHTYNIPEKCRKADIIISVTGKVNLVDSSFVKEGAVVIDVGFEVVNGKIMGDVDKESLMGIAKAVSAVPGGVGLLCNLSTVINLYKLLNQR